MTDTYINTTIQTDANATDAFDMTGVDDTLFLASTGSLIALGTNSNGLDMQAGEEIATLDGTVYSAHGSGVADTSSGGSFITVNGEVDAAAGDGIYANAGGDTILVNGSVNSGADFGIEADGVDTEVTVNGSVTGSGGIFATANDQTIRVNGSVDGSEDGIQIFATYQLVDIGAKGDVYGYYVGLEATGTDQDVKNSGHISGGDNVGLFAYGSTGLTLVNDGAINGIEVTASSGTSIQNAGLISSETGTNAIQVISLSTGTFIENSGTVHGNLIADPTSSVTVQNFGSWNGQFQIESSSNSVFNTGTISNGMIFGTFSNSTSGNSIVNDGTIHGGIEFNTVEGTPGNDTLTNSGTIYGGVHMSTNETLTNTDTIHGNVYFSSGTTIDSGDTFDNSNGVVLGTINGGGGYDTFIIGTGSNTYNPAGYNDHFDFGASFGNDIIDGFKTGTGHDYISFSGGDFSSYTELQTHMTQVGGNTIITLESGSTIELHALTMTHLSSADFIFG